MKIKIEVDLKPFSVPNFVLVKGETRLRQEGLHEPKQYALNELDAETIDKLCDEFKREVFRKAGHPLAE